jgi:hydrogenase-4 component B
VAICGLPPLNGFVSEWLVYLGLFRTLGVGPGPSYPGAALAAPALGLIGALALACFVKVFGAVFLGTGRSEHAESAHEAGPAMLAPMLVLAGCCAFIGLAPVCVAGVLEQAVTAWMPELAAESVDLQALAPLEWVSTLAVALLAALVVTGSLYRAYLRRAPLATGPTWGCGYVAPTPRMQYTASSFAQMLVDLFAWALRPVKERPRHLPLFPQPGHFHSEVPDAVLDRGVLPVLSLGARLAARLRVFQQGKIQLYLLYVFLTLMALLLWR